MYDDVKKNRKNLCTAWLDHNKAYDNVPHSWIIESLRLAKIPQKIIGAISDLMHKWRTKVYLYGETSSIETNFIDYLRGILKGDTLSLLLFALSVNPLSYLLSKEDGFKLAVGKLKQNLSHLFFVDDLKLFTTTRYKLLKHLGTVTQFSNDVGMVFGESKCAYQCIERGKLVILTTPIEINRLTIKETKQGDHYRYLGMDETIRINNVMNKENAVKEYKNRLKKIWSSELNGMNKTTAHNTFAVPVISYTVGMLDCTKKEIQDLDITTRKYLAMNGSFHKASDINRLYTERKRGGRGLLNLEDIYENRIIGMKEHLTEDAQKHSILKIVEEQEKKGIIRPGQEFEERIRNVQGDAKIKDSMKKEQEQAWKQKVTHGYMPKKLEEMDEIDMKETNSWLQLRLTSHLEGYINAIQEQELNTKETRKRREKDQEKRKQMDTTCRVCGEKGESVYHLRCNCPILAPTLYLTVRHNQVARILYQEIIQNKRLIYKPPKVTKVRELEIWWDNETYTVSKVDHNRPDMVIWDSTSKQCQIVEVTVSLDTNLPKAYKDKKHKYITLVSQMQQMYREYKTSITIIAVGALGAITKTLTCDIQRLGITKEKTRTVIHRIQRAAFLGTVKVCKTVLKM